MESLYLFQSEQSSWIRRSNKGVIMIFTIIKNKKEAKESTDLSTLDIMNKNKETMLYSRLEKIERRLKEIDDEARKNKYYKDIGFIEKHYYLKKLKIIDDLFIKADYYDNVSANLIMDEISDKISKLERRLSTLTLQ